MLYQTDKKTTTTFVSRLAAVIMAGTMMLGAAAPALAQGAQTNPAPRPPAKLSTRGPQDELDALRQENVRLKAVNNSLAAANLRLLGKNRHLFKENVALGRMMVRFRSLYVKTYGKLRSLLRSLARMFGPWRRARVSWYGPGFYGGGLAGGGVLKPGMRIFAHRSMRFGTKVQFSYRGRRVIAVCKDRGPFISGRTFDLGPGTAKALRFDGVDTVRWRIVRR